MQHSHAVAAAALAAALLVSGPAGAAGPAKLAKLASFDRPTREVWPAARSWDASAEAGYGAFVAAIGRAAAAGRCRTLAACLNEPAINPLLEPGVRPLRFHADCADVPYILRAYYAYRHGLPFTYARQMLGQGRDARYYRDARPDGLALWTESPTPRHLLEHIGGVVHSGYFRTAPAIEEADFYQAAVAPGAVRPGTMFYDPNGHVLVVYEIGPDGVVRFFDGHPDGYLTHGELSEKNVVGTARFGGGFKNFRPLLLRQERVVRACNAEIADFGGAAPFDRAGHQVVGRPASYYDWVRARLATAPATTTGPTGAP